jgi:hypothetical protein
MSVVIGTPAGRPSSVATSAGPWDSPAVSQRNLLNGAPHARALVLLRTRVLAYDDGVTGCAALARHPPILPRPGHGPGRRSRERTRAGIGGEGYGIRA